MSEERIKDLTRAGRLIIDHHETIGNIVMDESLPIINVASVLVDLFELDLKSDKPYLAEGKEKFQEVINKYCVNDKDVWVDTLVDTGVITEYKNGGLTYYYLSSPYKAYLVEKEWK